jgi:hypothetical protein
MASGSDKTTKRAHALTELIEGNRVFRGAAVALGLQGHTARLLLHRVLAGAGIGPERVTPEELGSCLPEIEVLVRKLLPPEMAQERMQRLQKFLISIDDHG